MDFSIVILSRGRAEYSRRLLTILGNTPPAKTEYILVDDGTPDDSVQRAFSEFTASHPGSRVKVIRHDESLGAVAGRNEAVEASSGEFIVCLDNDCFPRTRDWLAGLKHALDTHRNAAVIGPRLVYPLPGPDAKPTIQCAGCVVSLSGRVGFRGRGEPADDAHFGAEERVQAVISACWITPRSVWDAVGGMDMAFSPCQFEDIDYCYKARQQGLDIWYTPEVAMYHFENTTSGGLPGTGYAALTARNSRTFQAKWREFLKDEGAPHPSTISWRTDIPAIRLEDNPVIEVL